jgi:peptidyl-prolyl cis-trans isomerase B (cyclophilin B)
VLTLAACGSNDDTPPLDPTATTAPQATATTVLPTVVPPVCEGEGISDIERTGERRFTAYPDMIIDTSKTYVAEMQTTKGDIVIELAASEAPLTVNSFVFLSCNGYYDGLTFHRVEKQALGSSLSIIQGGDPRGNGTGGPGYTFENEISDLTHEVGAISMANAGPDTNGSQFFITSAAAPALDGSYSVFGKVTEGQDVVDSIAVGDVILAISIREAS